MMISQWLRRLIESHYPTVDTEGANVPWLSPGRQAGVGLEPLEGRKLFAVFTVDSTLDGPAALIGGNGKTELREAMAAAEANPGADTIRFSAAIDGRSIGLIGADDISAGPSAFLLKNGSQLTIDGQTGLSRGVSIVRAPDFSFTIGTFPFAGTTPPFRLATVSSGAGLTLKGLTIRNFVAQGGAGGSGQGAGGGGAAGMGGVIFNSGYLTILNSTLAGNTAQGGAGGTRTPDTQFQEGPGSGGGGMFSAGGGTINTQKAGGAGGSPNPGVGGEDWGDNGTPGGFGGGGGGGSRDQFIAQFVGRGGAGGFGGGGGGGGSDGTGVISRDYVGGRGGWGGFGGGGGAAGYGAKGSDVQGGGGFGGGDGTDGGGGGGGAGLGGVVFNNGGVVSITNSTFTGNSAIGGKGGGGVGENGTDGDGLGGVIFGRNGNVLVSNSTLSGNTAKEGGRGAYLFGDAGLAYGSFLNTIIGQSDNDAIDLVVGAASGGATSLSGSNNLIRTTLYDGQPVNYLNAYISDPRLSALRGNGGVVPTMLPQDDSPIRGKGIGATPVGLGQTITFGALPNRTYGDADFALSATSSSGLPVSFTASGNATVFNVGDVWYARITGAGTATITAVSAGNSAYEAAESVSQSFTIAKAATVTTTVGATFTYDGKMHVGGSGTVTGAGGLNTGATVIVYSGNADDSGEPDFVNAGTYYVTAYYTGDANYLASAGTPVAVVINKANATVSVTGYTGTYDGLAHGATGTAIGVNGTSVGTLNLGASFTNVPGGTAYWTFDGGRNYVSEQGAVAIQISAKHITGTFTAADKTYDGTRNVTVLTRTLVGLAGNDAVTLTGGNAIFASKDVGVRTVTLIGATLRGAAASNYVLDSVAATTATISRMELTKTATTDKLVNVASNSPLAFTISLSHSDFVDGQTAPQLFNGSPFVLTVGMQTYSVKARATVSGSTLKVSFDMTKELKAILAANTTATNGGKATPVALNLVTLSKDGNYVLRASASTKLFNTSK